MPMGTTMAESEEHQQAEAVDAEVVFDAECGDPGVELLKLDGAAERRRSDARDRWTKKSASSETMSATMRATRSGAREEQDEHAPTTGRAVRRVSAGKPFMRALPRGG